MNPNLNTRAESSSPKSAVVNNANQGRPISGALPTISPEISTTLRDLSAHLSFARSNGLSAVDPQIAAALVKIDSAPSVAMPIILSPVVKIRTESALNVPLEMDRPLTQLLCKRSIRFGTVDDVRNSMRFLTAQLLGTNKPPSAAAIVIVNAITGFINRENDKQPAHYRISILEAACESFNDIFQASHSSKRSQEVRREIRDQAFSAVAALSNLIQKNPRKADSKILETTAKVLLNVQATEKHKIMSSVKRAIPPVITLIENRIRDISDCASVDQLVDVTCRLRSKLAAGIYRNNTQEADSQICAAVSLAENYDYPALIPLITKSSLHARFQRWHYEYPRAAVLVALPEFEPGGRFDKPEWVKPILQEAIRALRSARSPEEILASGTTLGWISLRSLVIAESREESVVKSRKEIIDWRFIQRGIEGSFRFARDRISEVILSCPREKRAELMNFMEACTTFANIMRSRMAKDEIASFNVVELAKWVNSSELYERFNSDFL